MFMFIKGYWWLYIFVIQLDKENDVVNLCLNIILMKGRNVSGWLPGSPAESFTKACLVLVAGLLSF